MRTDNAYILVMMRLTITISLRWWEWWCLSMMMMRLMYIRMIRVIYDDDEYHDILCACIRVVHFSGSLSLICELFEYVYTCVTCRIYFYAFI